MRHGPGDVARQIDLICMPQLMSAQRPQAAPNGGYLRARSRPVQFTVRDRRLDAAWRQNADYWSGACWRITVPRARRSSIRRRFGPHAERHGWQIGCPAVVSQLGMVARRCLGC